MKTGNVILAIFLWLCIPASFFFGGLFGLFGGGIGGGVICAIGAPLIFFILGLIVLLTGREKNQQQSSSQHVVVQQQTNPNKTYHSSIEEYCQMCGKPKGFDQFFLVTKDGKSLNVCEQCADEIERKDKGDNVVVEDEVLKVLKLRYAKGEITKEQFDQMKKDLEN